MRLGPGDPLQPWGHLLSLISDDGQEPSAASQPLSWGENEGRAASTRPTRAHPRGRPSASAAGAGRAGRAASARRPPLDPFLSPAPFEVAPVLAPQRRSASHLRSCSRSPSAHRRHPRPEPRSGQLRSRSAASAAERPRGPWLQALRSPGAAGSGCEGGRAGRGGAAAAREGRPRTPAPVCSSFSCVHWRLISWGTSGAVSSAARPPPPQLHKRRKLVGPCRGV